MISLLGIRPNGTVLYRSNNRKDGKFTIVMESITEKDEEKIDKSVIYYNEIRYVKDENTIIRAKDIYLYGKVDFDNDDDLDFIEKFNLINSSIKDNNMMHANFNYDNGTCTTINGVIKTTSTWDAIEWFMYNYVLIGKPERIIVYKKHK